MWTFKFKTLPIVSKQVVTELAFKGNEFWGRQPICNIRVFNPTGISDPPDERRPSEESTLSVSNDRRYFCAQLNVLCASWAVDAILDLPIMKYISGEHAPGPTHPLFSPLVGDLSACVGDLSPCVGEFLALRTPVIIVGNWNTFLKLWLF